MCDTVTKTRIHLVLHCIDNIFVTDLINKIEIRGLKYQIASPENHRTFLGKRGTSNIQKTL